MKREPIALTIALLVTVALALLAGLAANRLMAAETDTSLPPVSLRQDASPLDRSNSARVTSYADVLDRVTPAVVSVRTAHLNHTDDRQRVAENLLRRFYGLPPRSGEPGDEIVEQGLGSGFIVSADGYVLTNHHVIAGRSGTPAEEIVVQLGDGREYDAVLIGTDAQSDLAVLKIDPEGRALPFLTLGDSSGLRVGDIVFAVGNPLGVGLTVTQGIVSALERTDLGIIQGQNLPALESFIQTDAAINMGNSGGPLVDAAGRVVGVNSAIASNNGGSIGIGFAIPVNLAARVMRGLVDDGEIRRGFIGVELAPLDRDLARAFALDSARGALVNRVTPGLPGAQAGLRHGDVVLSMNGQGVDSVHELIYLISNQSPGTTVTLGIMRDGKPMDIPVTLGDRAKLLGADATPAVAPPPPPAQAETWVDGVQARPLTNADRRQLNLPADVGGLLLTEVNADSAHARTLAPGMVVESVNGQATPDPESARQALRPDGANALYVFFNGTYQYVPLIVKKR